MKRALLAVSATVLVSIVWASPALGNHVSCGDVITQNTTLDSDLVDCPGDGVVIGADNIILDLAGHTIDGVGGGAGGSGVDNDAGHDGVTVVHGHLQEFHSGVYLDHADGGLLGRLTIANTGSAFELWDSDFNTVERNVLSTGINLYADSDGNAIDRNTINGAGTAVLVAGFDQIRHADGNTVTRNRLTGAGESYGVFVALADDTVIEGNDIRHYSGSAISLATAGLRNRIEGNAVLDTGLDGIALDGTVRDTLVAGNRVTGSALDGIRLGTITVRTVVERNDSSRNGDDGIDSDTASATITSNKAKFNFDLGIEAVPGVTDGGGNKAHGNGDPAQCDGVSCG